MVTDPVCKMQIDESKAAGKSEYQGKTYYFCAMGCKTKFDQIGDFSLFCIASLYRRNNNRQKVRLQIGLTAVSDQVNHGDYAILLNLN